MNITTYFLKHPVIAIVLNIMMAVIGILCWQSLSVREYPAVHFPVVQVSAFYPNASAAIVETSVTNPLEDRLAGVEGVETIESDSKYGASYISLFFKHGVSLDRALLSIREAVALVELPDQVKAPRVERKTSADGMPFMIISLESSSMAFAELTHYALLNLKNVFRGIKGVSSVEVWGQPYTYTIRLDARKMYAFGVNVDEIFEALRRSNVSLPVGKFRNEISATLNSQLKTIKDFENLVVREKGLANPKTKQSPILLKDVADIKLETDENRFRVRVNGKPGLCLAIQKANDANPLEVSALVDKQLQEVRQDLPENVKLQTIHDQAEFIRHSLKNVKSSIYEAILFVLIIIFLFLRNLKATVVPFITIPISLMGSFVFLKAFGFSINVMTLLAMVLAIGLVVDDAIIVLENIQRHIDKGLSSFEASLKGAKEIGFAIVAMTLTLTSVYAPLAFIQGSIGEIFIEFAVALAGSVLVSGVVALTLSPLMCMRTLRQHQFHSWSPIDKLLDAFTQLYSNILTKFIANKKYCAFVFISTFSLIGGLLYFIPTEIAPKEDRNLIGVFVPPIVGKTIDTLESKLKTIEKRLKNIPEAKDHLVFMGDWGGNVILPLKPQSLRTRSAREIVEDLEPFTNAIPSLDAYPWSWDTGLPGIDESMGEAQLSLIILTHESYRDLFHAVEKARKALEKKQHFQNVRRDLKIETPSYRINVDTNKMAHLGITNSQIAKTVEVFFSGNQTLSFFKDDLQYPLTIKGKQSPWNLNELYITNKRGKRISLGVFARMKATSSPNKLHHYNQMRSMTLSADLPKGETLGTSMKTFLNQVSKELPQTYKKQWVGFAKVHGETKNTMITLFILALVFIFAILAVQFESFIDPLIILVTVPLACLGALSLIWIFDGSLNIYTQIEMITLVGLITKHGILIVEFANKLQKEMALSQAIIQASSLRLRPILMTTGAMLFGAVPLILSYDAGYEARRAIGIVLVGGLSMGTFFTLFILPTVYFFFSKYTTKKLYMSE